VYQPQMANKRIGLPHGILASSITGSVLQMGMSTSLVSSSWCHVHRECVGGRTIWVAGAADDSGLCSKSPGTLVNHHVGSIQKEHMRLECNRVGVDSLQHPISFEVNSSCGKLVHSLISDKHLAQCIPSTQSPPGFLDRLNML